jgi:hypothetical protein
MRTNGSGSRKEVLPGGGRIQVTFCTDLIGHSALYCTWTERIDENNVVRPMSFANEYTCCLSCLHRRPESAVVSTDLPVIRTKIDRYWCVHAATGASQGCKIKERKCTIGDSQLRCGFQHKTKRVLFACNLPGRNFLGSPPGPF